MTVVGRDIKAVRFEGEGPVVEVDGRKHVSDILLLEDGTKLIVPAIANGGAISGVDQPWEKSNET